MKNLKDKYTKKEFNSTSHGFGTHAITNAITNVKRQTGVVVSEDIAIKLLRIENMCTIISVGDRIVALNDAGLIESQNPMYTGNGVGTCYRYMKRNNVLRIRVSANWSGGFENYATNVHLDL